MNSMFLLAFALILLTSCRGKNHSDAEAATVLEAVTPTSNKGGNTLGVDLASSSIAWKATKMGGTDKHEGDIQFQSAYLLPRMTVYSAAILLKNSQALQILLHLLAGDSPWSPLGVEAFADASAV